MQPILYCCCMPSWHGKDSRIFTFFEHNQLRNLCGHKTFLRLTGLRYILRAILCGSVLNRWRKNQSLQYVRAWDTSSGPWLHLHCMRDLQNTHDRSSTYISHALQYTHNSNTTLHTWSTAHSQQQHYMTRTAPAQPQQLSWYLLLSRSHTERSATLLSLLSTVPRQNVTPCLRELLSTSSPICSLLMAWPV